MIFLSKLHEDRFNKLLERSALSQSRERKPLFYILAAFEDTYKAADRVYNFDSEAIFRDCTKRLIFDFDSHSELIKLAFNLYNSVNKCNICDVMISCGKAERTVAVEAIKLRWEMEENA